MRQKTKVLAFLLIFLAACDDPPDDETPLEACQRGRECLIDCEGDLVCAEACAGLDDIADSAPCTDPDVHDTNTCALWFGARNYTPTCESAPWLDHE